MNEHSMVKSEDVIGVKVENQAGENLGKVEELILDKFNGNVIYVVLSFGGILGMGSKLFAMPWKIFSYQKDRECFVIPCDKEKLENSPGFDEDNWPDMEDRNWRNSIDEYYSDVRRF